VILVDTSAWVEFDRATESPVDTRLTELIAASDDVAVSEPVIMEVRAGWRWRALRWGRRTESELFRGAEHSLVIGDDPAEVSRE
jgi:predicted nucleic acid-binding protein